MVELEKRGIRMNIEEIKKASTNRIGKQIIYQETMTSTHLYAKENIDNLLDGTLVITEEQTGGIGTKNRKWYTRKGENLTFTIVLKPNIPITALEGFTMELAQMMKEVIKENYDVILEVKIPNDLLLQGKKIAGILTESSCSSGIVKNLWISMGMNVNQTEFLPEIQPIATSLKKELGKEFLREPILTKWIEKLERSIEKRESK